MWRADRLFDRLIELKNTCFRLDVYILDNFLGEA